MVHQETDRYPIGRFVRCTRPLDAAERAVLIDTVARTPAEIRQLVEHLTEASSRRRIATGDGPFARSFIMCPTAI